MVYKVKTTKGEFLIRAESLKGLVNELDSYLFEGERVISAIMVGV